MNLQKEYLRQRREYLVLKAETQRNEVTELTSHLQHDLGLVNKLITVGKAIRMPLITTAATLLLVRAPRHAALFWVSRLLTAWQLFKVVRKQWQQQH